MCVYILSCVSGCIDIDSSKVYQNLHMPYCHIYVVADTDMRKLVVER